MPALRREPPDGKKQHIHSLGAAVLWLVYAPINSSALHPHQPVMRGVVMAHLLLNRLRAVRLIPPFAPITVAKVWSLVFKRQMHDSIWLRWDWEAAGNSSSHLSVVLSLIHPSCLPPLLLVLHPPPLLCPPVSPSTTPSRQRDDAVLGDSHNHLPPSLLHPRTPLPPSLLML
ncbi:unnamed protein product [Pleuronectes platessa]|uniref:Uncharacterized protein n=1 Tax=Pleuronectes platessa TaxID=8262 RepID=A0A9N7ZDK0_PLEPL|nr:unnamed protein product [Pleuronectes platessa]